MDGLQTLYLACCLYENKENEWLGEVVLCDRNEGKLLVPGSFLFPIVCRSRDYLSWTQILERGGGIWPLQVLQLAGLLSKEWDNSETSSPVAKVGINSSSSAVACCSVLCKVASLLINNYFDGILTCLPFPSLIGFSLQLASKRGVLKPR